MCPKHLLQCPAQFFSTAAVLHPWFTITATYAPQGLHPQLALKDSCWVACTFFIHGECFLSINSVQSLLELLDSSTEGEKFKAKVMWIMWGCLFDIHEPKTLLDTLTGFWTEFISCPRAALQKWLQGRWCWWPTWSEGRWWGIFHRAESVQQFSRRVASVTEMKIIPCI